MDPGAIHGFDELSLELANLVAVRRRGEKFFEAIQNDDELAIERALPFGKPGGQLVRGSLISHCIGRVSNDARERLIDVQQAAPFATIHVQLRGEQPFALAADVE